MSRMSEVADKEKDLLKYYKENIIQAIEQLGIIAEASECSYERLIETNTDLKKTWKGIEHLGLMIEVEDRLKKMRLMD